jgi:hypothetical protein
MYCIIIDYIQLSGLIQDVCVVKINGMPQTPILISIVCRYGNNSISNNFGVRATDFEINQEPWQKKE